MIEIRRIDHVALRVANLDEAEHRCDRKRDQAEDSVLQALEAAPGFRPAQKLLLELSTTALKK